MCGRMTLWAFLTNYLIASRSLSLCFVVWFLHTHDLSLDKQPLVDPRADKRGFILSSDKEKLVMFFFYRLIFSVNLFRHVDLFCMFLKSYLFKLVEETCVGGMHIFIGH